MLPQSLAEKRNHKTSQNAHKPVKTREKPSELVTDKKFDSNFVAVVHLHSLEGELADVRF